MYERRFYRESFGAGDLVFFDVCVRETDLTIGASRSLEKEAWSLVMRYREQLQAYIVRQPAFLESLVPVSALPDAPPIVAKMCAAAEKAGVGPMAAVAGAVAEMVGRDLAAFSDEILVENGGDIFIRTSRRRRIGIYAGTSPLSGKLALEIEPERTPLGVCTSSGTVGPSLSFGKADAAVVVAGDAFLADAAATAVGNAAKTPGDIERALAVAAGIDGVRGAVVIVGDRMGARGEIRLARL